jgi:hypothetical protein
VRSLGPHWLNLTQYLLLVSKMWVGLRWAEALIVLCDLASLLGFFVLLVSVNLGECEVTLGRPWPKVTSTLKQSCPTYWKLIPNLTMLGGEHFRRCLQFMPLHKGHVGVALYLSLLLFYDARSQCSFQITDQPFEPPTTMRNKFLFFIITQSL